MLMLLVIKENEVISYPLFTYMSKRGEVRMWEDEKLIHATFQRVKNEL